MKIPEIDLYLIAPEIIITAFGLFGASVRRLFTQRREKGLSWISKPHRNRLRFPLYFPADGKCQIRF